MTETEKYKLKKPEQNDLYNVDDFNHNADTTDAALLAHDESLADLAAYIGYTAPDIYGVEVDFENNRFTRLAGAVGLSAGSDFDNITPWKRRRCNMTHDGVVTAYYGDENYTETGLTTVEITSSADGMELMPVYPIGTPVNVMVEQPPFYYKFVPLKLEKVGDGEYAVRKARYYVSATPKEGFKLHPVFSGEESAVYFAAYESCIYDTENKKYETILSDTDTVIDLTVHRLASVANTNVIMSSRSFTDGDAVTSLGVSGFDNMLYTRYHILDEDALSATQLLFLIEHASFDSQTCIGAGMNTLDGAVPENTGSTASFGNASGSSENGAVSYRGEENLWGHHWWATGETYEASCGFSNGYISAFLYKCTDSRTINHLLSASTDRLLFCNAVEALGDSTKPVCDMTNGPAPLETYILHGGNTSGSESGLFALHHTPAVEFSVRIYYSSRNSDIRDTDMAEEMTEYTEANVL